MLSRRLVKTTLILTVLIFVLSVLPISLPSLKRSGSATAVVEEEHSGSSTTAAVETAENHEEHDYDISDVGGSSSQEPLIHRTLYSLTTKDRQYMRVYMGEYPAYNPNIIPHPTKIDYWILVAQHGLRTPLTPSEHIACVVGIQNDFVLCAEEVTILPLVARGDGKCTGDLEFVQWVWGSRDARVFYGPHAPYISYGAQSDHICFAQWLQDFRVLMRDFARRWPMKDESFQEAIEMQRPGGNAVEKNYFVFWDTDGVPYVHYDLWPKRGFSRLKADGSPSENLADKNAYEDLMCLAKFLPSQRRYYHQDIHQATNSLSITLCKRSQGCPVSDANTFIMHIFHLKTFHHGHPTYEPYVVLFRRSSPFGLYAISQKPYWISGRGNLTEASGSIHYEEHPEYLPSDQTEMFYLTSMSWREHTQTYHGYIDDVLFLAFGIEDSRPGVIDVLAGDLLQDLAFC